MVKRALKIIAVIELLVIIVLAVFLFHQYNKKNTVINEYPLISPRISAGVLESQSYLILNFKPLQDEMKQWIDENKINVSVYVENIRDGASFGINSTNVYRAVSFNKLPLAIIIMRKIEENKLDLTTQLPITAEDRDGRDGTLYLNSATTLSVRELLRYMLSESDNTAFNVLRKQATMDDLFYLSNYLNYYNNEVNTTSIADNVYDVSPKSVSNLFMSLYLSTALKPEDSELILKDLTDNSFDVKKYANIPSNVVISHKYGVWNPENNSDEPLFHDCGIMYIQDSRIFYCVMTQGLQGDVAYNVVGSIVDGVYLYVSEGRKMQQTGINV